MNNHPKTTVSFMLLAVYLLTACSPVIPTTPTARPNMTATQLAAVVTPTVEPTETSTPQTYSDNLTRDCVKILSSAPADAQLTGQLAISVIGEDAPDYLLDLSTGNKIALGKSGGSQQVVSEDGKLLARWDLNTHSVIIADNQGRTIRTIPDPDERLTPAHWLDDQQLILNHRRGERQGPYVVSSLVILDVSTGKMQEWLPDYPNLDIDFSPVSWSIASRFLPNPQLTYLVYLRQKGGLIMWDISAKQEIASIPGYHNGDTPWWSPDGSQIVTWAAPILYDSLPYLGGGDLYTMDISGNMKRLTYLTTTQLAIESNYQWSPDGKSIAFLLQTAPDSHTDWGTPELSILDLQNGQVTNLCISSGSFTWSPNGKYIAVTQSSNRGRHYEVYMVNLKNKVAWKIADNAIAEGWMVSDK